MGSSAIQTRAPATVDWNGYGTGGVCARSRPKWNTVPATGTRSRRQRQVVSACVTVSLPAYTCAMASSAAAAASSSSEAGGSAPSQATWDNERIVTANNNDSGFDMVALLAVVDEASPGARSGPRAGIAVSITRYGGALRPGNLAARRHR